MLFMQGYKDQEFGLEAFASLLDLSAHGPPFR